MGFFEFKSKLWPKVISLSLDFMASHLYPQALSGSVQPPSKNLIKSFEDNGTISDKEAFKGKWPFGISTL